MFLVDKCNWYKQNKNTIGTAIKLAAWMYMFSNLADKVELVTLISGLYIQVAVIEKGSDYD